MRIGELADRAGVSVRALRYYEEQHLLGSKRSAGGQRQYDDAAVERVGLIQLLYAAGLPSRSVLTILPCLDTGTAAPDMVDRLRAERRRITGRIDELTATRHRLDDVIDAATVPASG